MYRARVIPCLLVRDNGLVKTRKFKDAVYIGDPVNAVRIFSDKEVDEIVVLDIDASREGREPNYELIEEMAGEAFMPMAYGGGIRTIDQVRKLIRSGIEKVVINSAAAESMDVIRQAAELFGSQAVVGAVDVRKTLFGGYRVVVKSASVEIKVSLDEHVQRLVNAGVGEIFLNSVDRDGMMAGYDIGLIQSVSEKVNVPVVACGGAGTPEHLAQAVKEGGASAVAAGSMFVFHGKHRAVLINYPKVFNF
ncbi:AglZ/HisF2 family acetamidino modification protein [Pseudomonas auratipiscis]|uniref:imidazole glycerol-phosphate synthase n=1 Tax=Pseudomonas auratipiscis TaxID=3115853 RepID=A0AB35WR36_9PSED|nr:MULTISPECIES: AglZ/HisF2 family acetamidino modification protein [unclassified Pseudomonas]MEE1867160.1 AglZ/HisF2 family acetamidino modification protein [Pseudomonas sp. 120P]MEE1957987.1 AglZ/HisF2 family acetamidino modification protein [Pseudomonas sp. 119P]